MLKITKGLNVGGIMTYTDDKGNKYVRVKMDGEDFCIAAYDFIDELPLMSKFLWDWNEVMESLEEDGMTMFTRRQATIYKDHQNIIDDKLKEIGGETLKGHWYWTAAEDDADYAWSYVGDSGATDNWGYRHTDKSMHLMVRPIIVL